MAKHVLRDAYISVDGTDLSDHCSSVTLEDTAEEVDVTGFTNSGYREFIQGLKNASISATFFNDYDASQVDSVLYPLYDSGGTFAVVVKPDSAATSSTNPSYTMTARLYSYGGLAGAVGDANTVDVTFNHAGTSGITRGTA